MSARALPPPMVDPSSVGTAVPVDVAGVLVELADRVAVWARRCLERSTPESLHWRVDPDANTVAINVWHIARWWDFMGRVLYVAGAVEDQHWLRDGWIARTGYDPRGVGWGGFGLLTGYNAAEQRAVPRMDAASLAEYHATAIASLRAALARESASTLGRTFHVIDRDRLRWDMVFSALLGGTKHLGECEWILTQFARTHSAE
jgi:hypothetical protein